MQNSKREESGFWGEAVFFILLIVMALSPLWIPAMLVSISYDLAKGEADKNAKIVNVIEGEVSDVEIITKDLDAEWEKKLDGDKKEAEESGEKSKSRFNIRIGPSFETKTTVTFIDGRQIIFNGLSEKPIEKGAYYKITYDGNYTIKHVVEVEQKKEQQE